MKQIRTYSQKVQEMIGELSGSMSRQMAARKDLAQALVNINQISQNISAATVEQDSGTRQVSAAVENVNGLTQAAASSAEEMSAATEALSSMASELQRRVAQFKIRNGSQGPASEQEGLSASRPKAAEHMLPPLDAVS
jgi:methyl-accepting chemotaxis protein